MAETLEGRCARCERPIPAGEVLCAECREEGPAPVITRTRPRPPSELEERRRRWPPSMVRPSPVQYHATVMVTIFLVLLGLALFAFLRHRGVGPFPAAVERFSSRPPSSVLVVATVANEGSKTSRANCRISALDSARVEYATETILTDPIPGGESVTIRHTLQGVITEPEAVRINCS